MTEIITADERQTQDVAKSIAQSLKPGSFIALYGDLGAGKTAFTRGLAKGLGVTEPVLSPTFTLLKVYTSGSLPLYHFDVYRIADPEELIDLGFYDLAAGDGICITEWAELIAEELPPDRLDVFVEYTDEADGRRIKTVPRGGFKEAGF